MNAKLLSRFPKALLIMVLLITLFGSQAARAAGECYVNAGASGGGNTGASWADAYTDLQSALGASPCTEVWVAAGTYKPTGGIDRAISFVLKNGVALYGGFAGTETQRSQRNPAANLTTLSGDIGAPSDATDNSYHVVSGGGTDSTAVLDGFTITAGNANGSYPADRAGGMYNLGSGPTLANLIFSSNSATYYGGGMDNENSNPALTNVTFSNNSALTGGGMYNWHSSPTLKNLTFKDNLASYAGGMYNETSSPTLTNATFNGNSVTNFGGGMLNTANSSPVLTNVTFSGNSASNGGGMYNDFGNPQNRDSIFWGNSASVAGAEIYDISSTPSLADSVIAGGCPSGATCTNILTTDPQLGLLGNNGGFTQTMALSAGSSAIDTGNDATCASTDQRGVARPQGAHCDMGAYEWIDYPYQIYLPLVAH